MEENSDLCLRLAGKEAGERVGAKINVTAYNSLKIQQFAST